MFRKMKKSKEIYERNQVATFQASATTSTGRTYLMIMRVLRVLPVVVVPRADRSVKIVLKLL